MVSLQLLVIFSCIYFLSMQRIKMPPNDKNFTCAPQAVFNFFVTLQIDSFTQMCTRRLLDMYAKFWEYILTGF